MRGLPTEVWPCVMGAEGPHLTLQQGLRWKLSGGLGESAALGTPASSLPKAGSHTWNRLYEDLPA